MGDAILSVQDPRAAYPYVLPALAMLGAVIAIPAVYVLWLSFHASTFGKAPTWVGLANYAKILADPYFWRAMRNTIVIVLVVVHVELVLGLGMALLFAHGVPFRKLMIACVLAPYAVSEVGAVVMWRTMFDPETGVLTGLITGVGLPPLEWSVTPAHGLALVSLLSVWLHLPFTFVILYAARLSIPRDLYEAAAIDGASPWQSFRRVTLPLLLPAMLIAMLFRYIFAYRLFSEVWLLTGGGPARSTEVVATYLYLEAFRYNDFGAATATGWVMVVTSLLLALVYLRRLYRDMMTRGA
jgi:multiple sugar transport system permease protein